MTRVEHSDVDGRADVIVVGAGASGLKAAQELVAIGRTVIVLEANDRIGGRLKAASVAGRVGDVGGQWVGVRHSALLAEAKRLGIETYAQYDSGKTVLQLVGKVAHSTGDVPKMPWLALLELFRLQRRWARDMAAVPAEAPWTAPRAAEWDALTLETWILRNVHTEAARAFARLVPRGAWAVEAAQVSYLWFVDALRGSDGLEHLMTVKGGVLDGKFKGGMHQIVRRMAEELGERIVLNAPVFAITQDERGVRAQTAKGAFEARQIIVAVAPSPAGRIRFEPHLPSARDGLHQRMPMGSIIKVLVAYREPFWRTLGFSGQVATDDDVVGLVLDDTQDVGSPVLLCFIEGRHAIAMSAAGRDARRSVVVQSLVRFFGPAAADPIGYEDNDWTIEPYTHGYVGHMPPGVMTRFGPALREPCGRIHWAGTETAEMWAGHIEGALRSGTRAAREVAARHND
jgi:monoamine oxidase